MSEVYGPYSDYVDSGVAWLGRMPGHWNLLKTKRFFDRVQRPVRENDGIVTAFRDGQVTLRSKRRTDGFTNATKEIGYQGVREGDLLVHAMDGFAGAIGVSDSEGKCSPVCSVCVPKMLTTVHVAYYGYLVRQLAVTDFISSLAKGIRERSTEFRYSEFSILPLVVPPLEEQTQIAKFLDYETAKIDALIDKQQQLIALLKEKRQAVISHAVTKGLNPDAPMKDSGVEWLGEVPAHWTVKKLRFFATVLRGKFTHRPRNDPAFYDGEFPFVQTGDITGASKFITTYKQTLNHRGASVSKEFPRGTLVMAIAANIGDVAILDFPAYFPDSVVGLKPNSTSDVMFLYYMMQAMKQPMLQRATISTQMNLNVDQIGWLTSACPPVEEQETIASYLDGILHKLSRLEAQMTDKIQLLQERRTALISAAVTGKIDVRGWKAPEADKEVA